VTVLPFGRVGAQLMCLRVRGFKVTATLRYLQMMSAYRSDWLGSKGFTALLIPELSLVPRRLRRLRTIDSYGWDSGRDGAPEKECWLRSAAG
jgi:hypothetical protein